MQRLGWLIVCLCLIPAKFLWAQDIVVTRTQGEPSLIRNGLEIPAATGQTCRQGDILKTTPGCAIDIALNNLAGCRVLASSECAIETADKAATHLKLVKGNAILNLDSLPKGTTFKVETPTAVAAVRGTQFWGRVNDALPGNPVTTFAVREGQVEITDKTSASKYLLAPGQALDIPRDQTLSPIVRPALPEEMQAMSQADQIQTSAA